MLNLEKQLEKVDELLETLQEEEWKDEEDGLLDDVTSDCDSYNNFHQHCNRPSSQNQICPFCMT